MKNATKNGSRIKIRKNLATGEVEVEGPLDAVRAWCDRYWSEPTQAPKVDSAADADRTSAPLGSDKGVRAVEPFGAFFSEFRPDIRDEDKVLIASAYIQQHEVERVFATRSANQLLIEQHVKVANAATYVRRLAKSKRVFAMPGGKFRVSAAGLEYLTSLKLVA